MIMLLIYTEDQKKNLTVMSGPDVLAASEAA